MPDASDMDLVREFARDHSEAAFAELVRRHLNLVYSAARRHAGRDGDAQDIAQVVFILLARKAAGLRARTVLTGWLYETTRFTAARWLRTAARRQAREQEAYMESAADDLTRQNETPADAWRQLAPHLEAAMSKLAERDRTLLALRFYENKTAPEAAALLGMGAEAAQKSTARALEKLRTFFGKRGITLTAAAIAGAVSGNAVQSAPAGLADAITAAALSGTALTSAAVLAAAKAIAMTTLQKTAITAALAATVGAGIFEARQISQLRAQNQALRQQPAALAGQIQELQRERDDATNRLAALAGKITRDNIDRLELLRLRSMAGVARQAAAEAERLRAQLARQTAGGGANPLTSAMADAMSGALEQQLEGKLARMTESLRLTPEQVQSIRAILMKQQELQSAGMQGAFTGQYDKDKLARLMKEAGNPETQIKALLTPDQLAAYPDYQRAEAAHTANEGATAELAQLESSLNLTADQLDPVYAALYQVSFDQMTGNSKPPSGLTNMGDVMAWTVDQKTAALEPLLTPRQLATYRQQQAISAKLMKSTAANMQEALGVK